MKSTYKAQPPSYDMMGTGAIVVHGYNVMDARDRSVFRARTGLTLKDLAPKSTLPTVCTYNGEFVHPADWELVEPTPDDHVGFLTLPKGGGGGSLQTVIGIILIVVGVVVPGMQGLIGVGAALLISGLMPAPNFAPLNQSNGQEPSPTYNLQLSGNSARLGQAIPVIYGRHIITPDFASAPYTTFDGADNQYYYALLCIGVMDSFIVESIMIDDTELSHFVDVETQFVGPQYGAPLSLVNPAVVSAPEVANQELPYGTYVGPFASCGSGLRAVKIDIDIIAPRGLFYADDTGNLTPKTATWMVEARPIDDNGAIAGTWSLLGSETLTLAQNNPVRRTYSYEVPSGRYEVRVQRLEAKDTNNRAAHEVVWSGMRAFLDIPVTLEPSANFLALKMKANNQLSGLSQRRIALIIRRMLPTWDPDTGWSPAVETRGIAPALIDVLKNPVYGGNVPDSRIDLTTLHELDLLWESRNDHFDGVFDKRVSLWAALTTIARAGRARPVMRGSVFTFIRDSEQELPVALFNMRNIQKGSFSIEYRMITEDSPDGLELEYFDQTTWSSGYVTMAVPGVVGEPIQPARASIIGISNQRHAQRECAYMVADTAYRRATISFITEMEGYLPAFGDLIAVAHDIAGWGRSGEIEEWTGSIATCTEELDWSVGDNYAILSSAQGDVYGPYKVSPGDTLRSMAFVPGDVPLGLVNTGSEMDRTRYAMGPASSYAKMCKILSIQPQSDDTVRITAVVEDNRVHYADLEYLDDPGGGSGGRRAVYMADDTPPYNESSDEQHANGGYYGNEAGKVGEPLVEGYKYVA